MTAPKAALAALWLVPFACDPKHHRDSAGPETRDTAPTHETGARETGADSVPTDSDPGESSPPPDSEADTEAGGDTQDTQDTATPTEIFPCGGWVTGPAPTGQIRLSDADAILTFADGNLYNGFVADDDGDGCAEVALVTGQLPFDYDVALLPGTLAGEFSIVDTAGAIVRSESYHQLTPVAIGDMDGDGSADDWMMGARGFPSHATDGFPGAVYMFSAPLPGEYAESDADATVWPPADSVRFADDISVGDANGDGRDDLAVGWLQSLDLGRVLVMGGPLSGAVSSSEEAVAAFESVPDVGCFGQYLTMESDLNADGIDDLVTTALAASHFVGGLYVFYAPFSGTYQAEDADVLLAGELAWSNTGQGIAGGADADQDGYEDLLVAAPTAGTVYLITGPVEEGATLTEASGAVFTGGATLGRDSVSLDQDLDADGFPDPVMADNSSRLVLLFYGPEEGHVSIADADAIFYEDEEEYHYMAMVAGVVSGGDTDGDAYDDLLITTTGPAFLFRGGPR